MNGYEKAVELGLSGTAAEQVAILQTLTVSDINVKAVQRWFRENELLMQGPASKMFGALQGAYSHESTPPEAIAGLDYLFATIFGDSAETLQTTNPTWSVKVWQLVQLVVQLVPQATGLVDSFYALEGGRPYKDYTTEQYETDAATAAADQQLNMDRMTLWQTWQDLYNAHIATVLDGSEPPVANLDAGIGAALAALRGE